MPFYAGFHPYFYTPMGNIQSIKIPGEKAYDVKTKIPFSVQDIDKLPGMLGKLDEINLVFSELTDNETSFVRSDSIQVKVCFDSSYRYVVIWSLKDKEFLCIEPWMGDNYDMNEHKAIILKPYGELASWVTYSFAEL